LSVSLLVGSVFNGSDDGILAGFEQAQSLQVWAKCLTFHPWGQISLSFGHYEICR
jgi:hypothetical protein